MQFTYEDTNNSGSSFNGNIWRMDWKNATGDPKRYEFEYDGLNRLKSAGYSDGASFNNHTTNYFDTGYSYDKNGNLKTLMRYHASNLIDDLVYTYPSGSNQLQSISDNGTTGVKGLGYKEGTSNYLYDNNGNMRSDHNATTIGYNFMNLPELVTYLVTNKIKYAYTATGTKLQKIVESPTIGDKVVDYIGPFLYEDNDLKCIFTSEGRLVKVNDGANVLWKYEYNLKDHLGNVRAVFAAHSNGMPELMQQTDYYPFGMVMAQQETFNLEEVKNKYLFNGKELQDDNIGIQLVCTITELGFMTRL